VVNLRIIGRRYPSIQALPFGPQLGDNIAFGVLIAALTRRPASVSDGSRSRRQSP